MSMIENFVQCMKDGNNVALADLFSERGVLHDSSVIRAGLDVIHLEGRMAVEMMYHNKFGFNGGPFKIRGISYHDSNSASYLIVYGQTVVPVLATISKYDDEGKIARMSIFPF